MPEPLDHTDLITEQHIRDQDIARVQVGVDAAGDIENWQVQELDGSVVSDHSTFTAALVAKESLRNGLQRPFRVRRTS